MPYTLAKFFVWALGFALIGFVVGWLLRTIRCSREVARARATTVDLAEHDRLRHRVANLEPIVRDRDRLAERVARLETELKAARSASPPVSPQGFAAVPTVEVSAPPDLDAARSVMGKPVTLDDLEIVEGIGPVISSVLRAGGITTWAELARTDADAIRSILVAADERHRMHDPSSWPRQAELAAAGQWEALRDLQADLDAGRG